MNDIKKVKCKNCGEEILYQIGYKREWIHDFSGSIVCENRKGHAEPEVEK